jgi:hypothetical protein
MSVFKVKNVVQHSAVFLPFPQVGTARFEPISLERWRRLSLEERAPVRSAAMVDVVGLHFVALIVDTVHRQLRWFITAPREQLWELYDGMLEGIADRKRDTVVISAPFLGAEARLPDGGHIDCESPHFLTKTVGVRLVSNMDGGPDPDSTPSQWPSSGPPGMDAGQSLLTAEGAVSLQGAPAVAGTDSDGDPITGALVPPS